jgi:histidine triad (HIT) family protein
MATRPCAFCAIARGEAAAHLVIDEPHVIAFLDTKPLFVGHVLVAPRVHLGTLADVAPQDLAPLFECVQRVMHAAKDALGAEGTFVAVNNTVSQSVPHLHVHVVPRTKGDGLRGFFWPRQSYESDAAMAATAEVLRAVLRS